jgi:hypothetical protein
MKKRGSIFDLDNMMKKREPTRRGCFGTYEYSKHNWICRFCPDYKDCGKVAPKRPNPNKIKRAKSKNLLKT